MAGRMQNRRYLKSAVDKVQFGKESFCSNIKGESPPSLFLGVLYMDKTRVRKTRLVLSLSLFTGRRNGQRLWGDRLTE